MASLGLGGWGENRLVQLGGVLIAFAQRDTADLAGLLITRPAGAGEVTANDALHREHVQFAHQHRAPLQIGGVLLQHGGVLRHVGGDEVVFDAREHLKPVQGHLSEHTALAGDAVRHHAVKRADAVRRHKQNRIAQVVDITDFATTNGGQLGNLGAQKSVILVVLHNDWFFIPYLK